MRSVRLRLTLALAIPFVALPPPAALYAEDTRVAGEIRVLCVRWDADTKTPNVYDPIEGQACAVAGTDEAATDLPENQAFARLDHVIQALQADIDAFRSTTETPDPAPLRWQVTAAGPNHLCYAAHSLLRYTSGAADVAGRGAHGTCPGLGAPEKNAATLGVVIDVVMHVNDQLRQRLGIAAAAGAASSPATGDGRIDLAEVAAGLLERLMATGRQIDSVLPVETTPADIYDRLEDAAGNLGGIPAESLPPVAGARQQAKDAADVYRLVFRCLRLSQVLEVKRNLETRQRGTLALSQWHGVAVAPNSPSLQIDTAKNAGSAGVTLADVYDLATLLAAQLVGSSATAAAIWKRSSIAPPEATLSDVFGLASALEAQLMKTTGITGRR